MTEWPKLRLLVIHEKGQDLDKALVLMKLGQFRDWFLADESHAEIEAE